MLFYTANVNDSGEVDFVDDLTPLTVEEIELYSAAR